MKGEILAVVIIVAMVVIGWRWHATRPTGVEETKAVVEQWQKYEQAAKEMPVLWKDKLQQEANE